MTQDTTRVQQNEDVANTKLRNVRVDDHLWEQAKESAKAEGETVSAVLLRALYAYVTDPQAFNAAVATIRGRR
jgi:hypothetical protein